MEISMSRMDKRGRLVVTRRLREKLGIAPGEYLLLYALDKILVAKKAEGRGFPLPTRSVKRFYELCGETDNL